MTPLREAFILPGLFLTVTLLGGLRVSDVVRLVPPTLSALVLAILFIGALVRARVLEPAALLHTDRRPLENLSGLVVLLTLLAATAQALGLVIPERGLLHFAFAVFIFVQLLSLTAARIDRPGMLRSLFVLLGASFVLRFIVLESLYSPDSGTLKRVLTALMAGVTLGGIEYQPHAAITGYAAFVTLALYMSGLLFLPRRPSPSSVAIARSVHESSLVPLVILMAAVSSGSACQSAAGDSTVESSERARAAEIRDELFAAARVWTPPVVSPADANLGVNPQTDTGFGEADVVNCQFSLEKVGGLTPKFNCRLRNETIVKVKYGRRNAELHAEVAATRLIAALGFPADRMYVVRSVRCEGCPRHPFGALRCHAMSGLRWPCFVGGLDFESSRVFDPAVIERRLEGRKIEGFSDQGWAWHELDRIDPSKGGSSRAEVDALRLLAAFLAHWDNKGENQRLICPPGADLPGGGCARPLAMMQDLGSTFGPYKVDLRNWRATPVWLDPRACRVSMEDLPYDGATYPERPISEEGRVFLLRLIEQFSMEQIEALFTGSRIIAFEPVQAEARSASAWAAVFFDKVRQIRQAGPCPPGQASLD